jgi:hypothetical protein
MLSALIDEMIDLKLAGEPRESDWISIDERSARRKAYWARLEELKVLIDNIVAAVEK